MVNLINKVFIPQLSHRTYTHTHNDINYQPNGGKWVSQIRLMNEEIWLIHFHFNQNVMNVSIAVQSECVFESVGAEFGK